VFVARGAFAVYLLAIFTPLAVLAALAGWRKWWRRTQATRAWLSDSINPESKTQRWHEDLTAVTILVLIVAFGVFCTFLVIVSWPHQGS
jgi:hypothetical protein